MSSVDQSDLRLEPVKVRTGLGEEEGRLVFAGEHLVAVLVLLEHPSYGAQAGHWFIEAGLGRLHGRHELFASPESALSWISEQL